MGLVLRVGLAGLWGCSGGAGSTSVIEVVKDGDGDAVVKTIAFGAGSRWTYVINDGSPYVGEVVDAVTRTVKVRCVVPNKDGLLKPDMFAWVDLEAGDRKAISLPLRAVLVDANVTLRKGNGDGFEPAFEETLGPGVECTVIERRPGWLRVRLPDGRSGWLREAQATDV